MRTELNLDNVDGWAWMIGHAQSRPYIECPNCSEHEMYYRRIPIWEKVRKGTKLQWFVWFLKWLFWPPFVIQSPKTPGQEVTSYKVDEYCSNCRLETEQETFEKEVFQ